MHKVLLRALLGRTFGGALSFVNRLLVVTRARQGLGSCQGGGERQQRPVLGGGSGEGWWLKLSAGQAVGGGASGLARVWQTQRGGL